MEKKIVVFGSFVVDLAGKTEVLPLPGQTVMGHDFRMGPGGKGSNQAVAAHRAGADVTLVTKLGKDMMGTIATDFYKKEGMSQEYVFMDEEEQTGIALISVEDRTVQNTIIVIPGACNSITKEEVDKCEEIISQAAFVVFQHEINKDAQEYAINLAYKHGTPVILNPAPAAPIKKEVLEKINTIIPNETEAYVLTGIQVKDKETAEQAAKIFFDCGVKNVVITMGSKGVYANDGENSVLFDSLKVEAIDTTGAGDAFIGGFSAAYADGKSLFDAVKFGNVTGALAVTKNGTATATPYKNEIDEFVRKYYPELL